VTWELEPTLPIRIDQDFGLIPQIQVDRDVWTVAAIGILPLSIVIGYFLDWSFLRSGARAQISNCLNWSRCCLHSYPGASPFSILAAPKVAVLV
jgi:hypothetical protein